MKSRRDDRLVWGAEYCVLTARNIKEKYTVSTDILSLTGHGLIFCIILHITFFIHIPSLTGRRKTCGNTLSTDILSLTGLISNILSLIIHPFFYNSLTPSESFPYSPIFLPSDAFLRNAFYLIHSFTYSLIHSKI